MNARETKKRGIANATSIDGVCYDVTYLGSRDFDRLVTYEYLKRLSKSGWEVHVAGVAYTPAHVIPAKAVES